ncbi:MAG: adenylate/guanylate cyclase domain-containing protein [Chloroflexota bacterium]|jgi:predicted ATPase/class 3 adenylate cyclase
MTRSLPAGTVTFLFTDIAGSSRLWERDPVAMQQAVARHDALLQAAVTENQGYVVKMRGDGLHAVFASAQDAVLAAVAGQRALQAEAWEGQIGRLPVRMGLHSGVAELRDGDYFGPTVNRAARLQDAAHGGQILLSQVSAGLLGDELPAGISLLDLGRHQIRDFPAEERVYQVLAPELPDSFPPLRALGGPRTNLPPQATSFVGRQQELRSARQLLEQARLVTLTGPGGTGKTRLSLQVAEELSGRFRDGVWLVELAPLTEGALVLPTVAKIFALQPEPWRPLAAVLADFLRDKKMLLLLDNCEHLIETCATLASEFLTGALGLKILASSREALGVPGEMILRVPSLSMPASDDLTAVALRDSEAAQLFSERARAVQHEFQITDENAAAIAEICRRLDGIPLAIELAASRLRLLSPEQLASRLNDRFRLLTGGSRTAVPRQQTLQALIDWSYDLLPVEEQALFRRLSVFTGGWTLEAAEAVGDGLDVLDLLDQLVKKSLVQSEQTAAGLRFRYLETIRQYARERMFAAGEGEIVRDLHFAYFSRLAADEATKFESRLKDEVRHIMKPELDNFRQALEWGLSRDTVRALDMLVGIVAFLAQDTGWGDRLEKIRAKDVQGWLETATESLEALGTDKTIDLRHAWTNIYLVSGLAAVGEGKLDFARQETARAVALARELGDQFTLLVALGFFSITTNAKQEFSQEAVRAAEECLALARKLGSAYYKGLALSVLAGYEMQRGNEAIAVAYLAEAARSGSFMSAMSTFQTAVGLARISGDPVRALPYFQESKRQFDALGNAHFVAIATSEIAHIQRRSGDLDAAEAGYRESLARFHWQGHIAAVAHELECLAFISRRRNDLERAARLLGAAEVLREQAETPMLANEHEEYDLELVSLKEDLDAGTFERAWVAGRVMGINQAVEFALSGQMTGDMSVR